MTVSVSFYSYFKDFTGCAELSDLVVEGTTVNDLVQQLSKRFPGLKPMMGSALIAVGVEYQNRNYILQDGDKVALFPPVQGG